MMSRRRSSRAVRGGIVALAALSTVGQAWSAEEASGRYVVTVRGGAEYQAVRASLVRSGAEIVADVPEIGMLVVKAGAGVSAAMAATADTGVGSMVPDRIARLSPPEGDRVRNLAAPGLRSAREVPVPVPEAAPGRGIDPDPAFDYKGLLWDFGRIGLPGGWRDSAGSRAVTVGVSDTGIDFTHAELKPAVVHVEDFTLNDDPSACSPSDRELARRFGGPVSTDWDGHGSWIGGNIAAALDGKGLNGIAPKVRLVALKIGENCGAGYFSNMIQSFVWAAKNGVDVVNISFGGYIDRSTRFGEVIYQEFVDAVAFARGRGTLIVASAGNSHARIGAGGKVLSHGTSTFPGDPVFDAFGLYQTPGGVPGVVDVASTGNRVVPSSAGCPRGTTGDPADGGLGASCKPRTDRHQAAGQGLADQLAYYSNYGPRIDVAAPGGARKFNLPGFDRGGTPGFPYVATDGTNVWEDFSTTSNFATDADCFVFTKGSGFPQGQCYAAYQGTSMAAPHVAAALALLASASPGLRRDPDRLVALLKSRARAARNQTQALSATDRSPGDLTGGACDSGYCHLGGPAVPDAEAYGAGIVSVAR